MFLLCAKDHNFDALNDIVRKSENDYVINDCLGQRFIADGSSSKFFTISRIPGNALGAYLNGAEIVVNGNAQTLLATKEQLAEFINYISEFCSLFGFDLEDVLNAPFTIITPTVKSILTNVRYESK